MINDYSHQHVKSVRTQTEKNIDFDLTQNLFKSVFK